eukprot:201954-Chlamydomonas_euryale.AAC.5
MAHEKPGKGVVATSKGGRERIPGTLLRQDTGVASNIPISVLRSSTPFPRQGEGGLLDGWGGGRGKGKAWKVGLKRNGVRHQGRGTCWEAGREKPTCFIHDVDCAPAATVGLVSTTSYLLSWPQPCPSFNQGLDHGLASTTHSKEPWHQPSPRSNHDHNDAPANTKHLASTMASTIHAVNTTSTIA